MQELNTAVLRELVESDISPEQIVEYALINPSFHEPSNVSVEFAEVPYHSLGDFVPPRTTHLYASYIDKIRKAIEDGEAKKKEDKKKSFPHITGISTGN